MMERSPDNHAELKFSTREMRREKSSHLSLQKFSTFKIIFPGSHIKVVHRKGLGSTDNSITSQTVTSAMLVPPLIRISQGKSTKSSSQSI